ncbi:MAG: hypothetical protein EYC70_13575 [Planctomycetota bacterium]|nr:MAG: hypothetical protein EYC70_13575 [Planctomycetota bacterium]
MAMRSNKPAPAPRRPAKPAKPERKPKVVVVEEEKPGMPVEAVLSLVTFLLLVAAILTIDYANGRNFGGGWLFKGQYEGQ